MIYLISFIAVLLIVPLFRLITLIGKRRNRRTAAEVAESIEKHIEGTEDPYDWDDFTTRPISDDYLDAVRLRCCDLGGGPPFSQSSINQLREIISELRQFRESKGITPKSDAQSQ
ncbi:MAG: hypothetical protein GZ088_01045 [Acidipila sp.]|nr:hypothetical protein [Acidipila sp.]